jgi:RNA polymerase sigma-70 factor (ECF subfamily)
MARGRRPHGLVLALDAIMTPATRESRLDDDALARQARDGSRFAFASLVERYQARVYRLALRMTRTPSDAEDIVQETFLRAHQAIRFFRGDSQFGTWLYRIAVNEVLMRRRAAARRPTQFIDDAIPRFAEIGCGAGGGPKSQVDDMVERRQLIERVHDALDALDDAHRTALVLRDLEELSTEEVAEIVAASPEVVRQRAHRARLKLREALARVAGGP